MGSSAEVAGKVRELIGRSKGLEFGATQVMLAEEAVRLADRHLDERLGYEARRWLVEAAVFSGMDERAVAPFTWCLARHDRDPRKFSDRTDLLWQYKWIVGAAIDWPQVPLERVRA